MIPDIYLNRMKGAISILSVLKDISTTTIIYQIGSELLHIRLYGDRMPAWYLTARAGSIIPSDDLLHESFRVPITIERIDKVKAIVRQWKMPCPYDELQCEYPRCLKTDSTCQDIWENRKDG